MKNQYFGDNRDLFKYDLIIQIIQAGLVNRFMFIPMLTENDDTGHGEKRDRKKAKAGTENEKLVNFLDKFKKKNKRDIEHLKSFLAKCAIEIEIYYGKGDYFPSQLRDEYFKQIEDELLLKSLILVDPDKGLQMDKSDKEHILYSEVKTLYDRMDRSSILMIFQYFPREKHDKYLGKTAKELEKAITGDLPLHIDDNNTIFFFLTKENKSLRKSLGKEISNYGETYHLRVGGT